MNTKTDHMTTYVDTTPAGEVALTHFTSGLDSIVLRSTPENAHTLAQMLITAAEEAWEIQQEIERQRTP